MASLEEIEAALRKADAAGNTEDAKRLADAYREMQAQPSDQYGDSYFAQGTSGVNEGLSNMLGLPVDLANAAVGLGMSGINKVAGTDFQPSEKPFLGSESIQGVMGAAIRPETDDPLKQGVRRIGEEVGASVIPGMGPVAKAAKPASVAAALLASAAGSGAGAAAANQVAPDNALAELGGQLAGGILPSAISGIARRSAAQKAAPSVDDLKAQAGAKYDSAARNGVTASKDQTQKISGDIKSIIENEGLITPKGRISNSYPKVTDSMRMIDDFAGGEMTVDQMQTVRKTLTKAAGSLDKDEARIGTKLLKAFDDFTSPLATDLADARGLYRRAMKGSMIDEAIELAGSRAGQFSGSGFENALRTEFRALERKIIKGQLKGLSEAEISAIKKVANGSPVQNVLRGIGKAAPTGIVSAAGAGGVPFVVGNAFGGPAVGAAAAAGTMGAGAVGRDLATRMGTNNANIASALMRRGSEVAQPILANDQRKVIGALLAAQAANQSANLQ